MVWRVQVYVIPGYVTWGKITERLRNIDNAPSRSPVSAVQAHNASGHLY